jgi:hypothetical protein
LQKKVLAAGECGFAAKKKQLRRKKSAAKKKPAAKKKRRRVWPDRRLLPLLNFAFAQVWRSLSSAAEAET